MRIRTTVLVALALAVVVGSGVASAHSSSSSASSAPRAASIAQVTCPKLFVIGARSSGADSSQESGMGAASFSFARRLQTSLLGYGWQGSDVTLVGLNYPAVSVLEKNWRKLVNGVGATLKISLLGAYHDSVVEGRKNLRSLIVRVASDCPSSRVILTGHSQGAQVVADVVQGQSSKSLPDKALKAIVGVVLFGDPYFNERDPFAGQFVQALPSSGGLGRRKAYAQHWRGGVLSYCHAGDPVCQSGGAKFSAHTNYGSSPESKQAAAYFATILGRGMSADVLGFNLGLHGLAAEGTENSPNPECSLFKGTLSCNALGTYPTTKKCGELHTVPAIAFSADAQAKQWYVCMDEGFHGWLPLQSDRSWKVGGVSCVRSWRGSGLGRHEELRCQAGKHGFTLTGGGKISRF